LRRSAFQDLLLIAPLVLGVAALVRWVIGPLPPIEPVAHVALATPFASRPPTPVDAAVANRLASSTPIAQLPTPTSVPTAPPIVASTSTFALEKPNGRIFHDPPGPTPVSTLVATVQRLPYDGESHFVYSFIDVNHGWIGQGTALLATADGGASWRPITALPAPITGVRLWSRSRGWVWTTSGAYTSADGGHSWRPLRLASPSLPSGVKRFPTDEGKIWIQAHDPCYNGPGNPGGYLSFVSATLGWAMCASGASAGQGGKSLYKTTDGGNHWMLVAQAGDPTTLPALPSWGYVAGLYFLDDRHGWIGESRGSLLYTDDGGHTWHGAGAPQPGGEGFLGQIDYLSPTQGYVVSSQGSCQALIGTLDGGTHWRQVFPAARPCGWVGRSDELEFVDRQHGFGAGTILDPGAVLATDDGGATWRQRSSLPNQAIVTLTFSDRRHGWASTESLSVEDQRSIYVTSDGGMTWRLGHPPRSLAVPRGLFGQVDHWQLADGQPGSRQRPPSNGTIPPIGYYVTSLSSLPDGHAWVVGMDGRTPYCHSTMLALTTDGGATWVRVDLGSEQLTSDAEARSLDDQDGWLLDPARLFQTTDGGRTWVQRW
jgi:photosystem II stability/assembly factor-like uncharacterized protein